MKVELSPAKKSFLRKWTTVAVSIVIVGCLGTFLYLRWFMDHHTRVANDKAASLIVSQLGDALKKLKSELEEGRCSVDVTAYTHNIDLQYLCGPYYGWAGTEACCGDAARIRIRIMGDEVWGCSIEGAPAGDDGTMRNIYRVKLYGGERLPPTTGPCAGKTFCDIHYAESIVYTETMLNRDCTFRKPQGIKASQVGSVTEPTRLFVAEKASGAAMRGTNSPSGLPYPLVPSELIKQIDRRGPRGVIRELFDRDEDWSDVLRNVARGEPGWLEVAARLQEGSDAHAGEELVEAVRSALTESPERVLELCRKSFPLNEICGAPVFGVDVVRLEQEIADLNRKIRALDRINSPDLAEERDKCKELIGKSIREILQSYGKTKPQ